MDLIEKYSADALRFTLLSMASPGTDVKLSEDRVKGYRNFLNKLWNANNFLITNECDFSKIDKVPKITLNINKWIFSELIQKQRLKLRKILKIIDLMRLLKMLINLHGIRIVTGILELSKTILFSDDEKAKKEVKEVSAIYLNRYLVFFILLSHL